MPPERVPPHDRASRHRRLARLAVELCHVAPTRPPALEREHLAAWLRGAACDGSFERTRAWAAQRRADPDALAAWAISEEAACDCELAARLGGAGGAP